MTEFESARLRRAFATMAELQVPEISEDVRERIWLAVSGVLPADERRDLIERMSVDPAYAEAWRVAHEMWLALQESVPHAVTPARAVSCTSRWLAAAAALLIATTVGIVLLFDRPPADEYRTAPGYTVVSLIPADMPLPRDAFRLQWTPGPDGSRYQVRVTTEDLRVLATAEDLTAAELVVEPEALTTLPGGATVLWQVNVLLPAGERLASPTFAVRVQ